MIAFLTFDLRGVGGAAGERQAATDDGGGVNDADFRRGDVKRPGAPLAVAGGAADDLGQDFLGVAALGDDIAVVAMGGEDIIVGVQPVAYRHAGGFLADVNMEVAANQAGVFVVEADAMFFGAPDHQHLAQDAELPIEKCRVAWVPPWVSGLSVHTYCRSFENCKGSKNGELIMDNGEWKTVGNGRK